MLDDDANDDMLIRMRMKVPMLVRMWMMMRVRMLMRVLMLDAGVNAEADAYNFLIINRLSVLALLSV